MATRKYRVIGTTDFRGVLQKKGSCQKVEVCQDGTDCIGNHPSWELVNDSVEAPAEEPVKVSEAEHLDVDLAIAAEVKAEEAAEEVDESSVEVATEVQEEDSLI